MLALAMISRALKKRQGVAIQLEHVFSCEIEPYKQAYIERNFSPPILFRDVRELGRDLAHNAYGALVPVPGMRSSSSIPENCTELSRVLLSYLQGI